MERSGMPHALEPAVEACGTYVEARMRAFSSRHSPEGAGAEAIKHCDAEVQSLI